MMVIVGGYETFVSRLRLHNHPDQPEWLSHVNASVLKVKLAMAIHGQCSGSIAAMTLICELGDLRRFFVMRGLWWWVAGFRSWILRQRGREIGLRG